MTTNWRSPGKVVRRVCGKDARLIWGGGALFLSEEGW